MSNQPHLFGGVANHSNLGIAFERDLETTHIWYQKQGWADVRKVPHAWNFISKDEYLKLLQKIRNNALPAGSIAECDNLRKMQRVKSDVDFVGAGFYQKKDAASGIGFGIVFDAKTSGSTNFPLALVKSHQLENLRVRHRCRIIAGIMVLMSQYNRVFFIGFKYLEERQTILRRQTGPRATPGTASISLADLELHAIEIFRHKVNKIWDWLPYLIQ